MKIPILFLTTTDGELIIPVDEIKQVLGHPEESTCMLTTFSETVYEISGTPKEIFEKIKQCMREYSNG